MVWLKAKIFARHGLPTVVVTLLAAATSYLINLATSSPTMPVVIGIVIAVIGSSLAELWLARSRREMSATQGAGAGAEAIPESASLFRPGLKRYRELVGRDRELSTLITVLRDPGGPAVKVVWAPGGMGKTALSYEAAYRLRSEGTFEHVVWADAQSRDFLPDRETLITVSDYDVGKLLDDICKQSGLRDVLQASQDVRTERVTELLAARRVLVVLENFETVGRDIRSVLLGQFESIRGRSRLIVNTREEVDDFRWPPLQFKGIEHVDDGVRFLRLLAKDEGFVKLADATQEELERIFDVTGGAPLAMRWIAGQVQNYDLDQALDNLRTVKADQKNLYHHIFAFSYNRLDDVAKDLLYMICVFQAPVDEATLMEMGELSEAEFRPAIKQLTGTLLVDDVGDLRHRLLTVHLLVRYFVDHEVKTLLRKDPQ